MLILTHPPQRENHLKRKRSELDLAEDELEIGDTTMVDCCDEDAAASKSLSLSLPTPAEARPKKRLRRLASAVVQTATAATVGAVATWAALAFS